jgi:PAS domain S-box-containing protein
MATNLFAGLYPGKWQAFLLVFAGFLFVVLTLLCIDRLLVQPAFHHLEHREALEDNSRAMAALEQELAGLSNLAHDWANWDDAYTFIESPSQAFIDSACPNLAELSNDSHIDLLAFVHRDGRLIFHSVFDPTRQQVTALSFLHQGHALLRSLLDSTMKKQPTRKGLIDSERGLLLLVAAGIYPSERAGAPRGLLLMGRFLNQDILKELFDRTKVRFDILPARTLTAANQPLFAQLQHLQPDTHPLLQGKEIYRLLLDIEGQPLALLSTEVRGEITALGQRMGLLLIGVLGAIALALLICLAMYRHRMQLAHLDLQISEDRYRQLFEAESDAIFLIDNDTGHILEANRAAAQLYQYTREELLHCSEGELLAEQKDRRWFVTGSVRESSEQVISLPLCLHRKKDGTVFPVEITGRIFHHQGRSFFIAAIRDISERQRMEQEQAELELLNRQLHKEESLGRMAGAIAHHFNNQLMTVTGFIQLAMDQDLAPATKADLDKALEAVHKATTISTLMQSYLGLSRCQREAGDLAAVCQRFLPMLHTLVPDSIRLENDLPLTGPIISLNIGQLQQIITNLLTNSIEAIEDAHPNHTGVITLRVRTEKIAELIGKHRFPVNWIPKETAYACLEVTDNGCGIAPEAMEILFDPFYTTKFTGRGLGLAVVLGLTKAHHGAIIVESTLGQGSSFRVLFPLLR